MCVEIMMPSLSPTPHPPPRARARSLDETDELSRNSRSSLTPPQGNGISGGTRRFCVGYVRKGVTDDVFECFQASGGDGGKAGKSKGDRNESDVRAFVVMSLRGLLQLYKLRG